MITSIAPRRIRNPSEPVTAHGARPMFAGDYQVVDVLMLVGNVAPIALYFLVLGLVNSHARPYLTTCRADFVTLTCVLTPVLFWPLPAFIRSGAMPLFIIGLFLAAALFVWLLMTTGTGFVIYNVSQAHCVKVLEEALHALGLSGRWTGDTWRDDAGRITIHLRKFTLLRNVTLHVETHDPQVAGRLPELGTDLSQRLEAVAQLPSTTGACLVLIGVALMILPMWMVGRHIHDIVDAMTNIFG